MYHDVQRKCYTTPKMKVSEKPTHRRIRLFNYDSPGLDNFGVVLTLTALLTLALLLVDITFGDFDADIGSMCIAIATATILSYSLRAAGFNRKYSHVVTGVLLFGVIATIVLAFAHVILPDIDHLAPQGSLQIVWVMVAFLTPLATTYRLLQHRVVTTRTLAAAIAAYLQIALAFTFLFLFIDNMAHANFFATTQPSTTFMYFSLVTISTVGYGDFASILTAGHAASALEAVVGQIYLVVVVAMLVGLYTSNRESIKGVRDK